MKRLIFNALSILMASAFLLSACKEPEPVPPKGEYEGGYFILNEGQFNHANATVSFTNADFSGLEDSVYYKVNGEQLGDVAQSMFFYDDKAYFVINNSHRIIVTDRWTMEKKGIMTSRIHSPRYMEQISDRFAIVSNWGEIYDANWQDVDDDFLAWVDLENDVVTDTMHIATGPDKMLFHGGKLYVLIPGVMTPNNKIAVVDPSARQVMYYIEGGDIPTGIAIDDAERIWVICHGKEAWTGTETAGKLLAIDPVTDQILYELDLATDQHPSFLVYKHGDLYTIIQHKLHKISVSNPEVNASTAVLDLTGTVMTPYGLSIINDKIFITDAGDYTSPGKVFVFDINDYHQITSFTAGYLPREVSLN